MHKINIRQLATSCLHSFRAEALPETIKLFDFVPHVKRGIVIRPNRTKIVFTIRRAIRRLVSSEMTQISPSVSKIIHYLLHSQTMSHLSLRSCRFSSFSENIRFLHSFLVNRLHFENKTITIEKACGAVWRRPKLSLRAAVLLVHP